MRLYLSLLITIFYHVIFSQCVEKQNIVIETRNSCSSNDNGIISLSGLYAKTAYTITIDGRNYNYTSNDIGVLKVYSLKSGNYKTIEIFDRINTCPTITLNEDVTIDEYKNTISGPAISCAQSELKLSSTHPSTWRLNSSTLSVNSSNITYTSGNEHTLEFIISANVQGCLEKDTLTIVNNEAPNISLYSPGKEYCYNKLNAGIRFNAPTEQQTNIIFNNESYSLNEFNTVFVDIGDQSMDNTLLVESTNDAGCKTEKSYELNLAGEAPDEQVEILWWPGNIFSAKNNTSSLLYQWGWIDQEGNVTYVDMARISADGKFYFAGINNTEVNEIINNSNNQHILFLEYKKTTNSCSNRLLFNAEHAPDAYYRFITQSNDNNLFKSYPNPFTEKITLSIGELPEIVGLNVVISNSSGKLIYQKELTGQNGYYQEIDMSKYSSGIYTASLHNSYYTLASQILIKQ